MVHNIQSEDGPLTYGEFKIGINMVLEAINELRAEILGNVRTLDDSRNTSTAAPNTTGMSSQVVHHEGDVSEEVKAAMELLIYDRVTEVFPPEDLATTATDAQDHADFIFRECFDDIDVDYMIEETRNETGVTVDPALFGRLGRGWILDRILWESNKNGNTENSQ